MSTAAAQRFLATAQAFVAGFKRCQQLGLPGTSQLGLQAAQALPVGPRHYQRMAMGCKRLAQLHSSGWHSASALHVLPSRSKV